MNFRQMKGAEADGRKQEAGSRKREVCVMLSGIWTKAGESWKMQKTSSRLTHRTAELKKDA
jgi:hypothetical protein